MSPLSSYPTCTGTLENHVSENDGVPGRRTSPIVTNTGGVILYVDQ